MGQWVSGNAVGNVCPEYAYWTRFYWGHITISLTSTQALSPAYSPAADAAPLPCEGNTAEFQGIWPVVLQTAAVNLIKPKHPYIEHWGHRSIVIVPGSAVSSLHFSKCVRGSPRRGPRVAVPSPQCLARPAKVWPAILHLFFCLASVELRPLNFGSSVVLPLLVFVRASHNVALRRKCLSVDAHCPLIATCDVRRSARCKEGSPALAAQGLPQLLMRTCMSCHQPTSHSLGVDREETDLHIRVRLFPSVVVDRNLSSITTNPITLTLFSHTNQL